ncbi:MAG TPA: hypothetical protein VFL42_02950 [Terriglobales bacterium]|nr:hypothetical protein [Terriglobales bacterium]
MTKTAAVIALAVRVVALKPQDRHGDSSLASIGGCAFLGQARTLRLVSLGRRAHALFVRARVAPGTSGVGLLPWAPGKRLGIAAKTLQNQSDLLQP